MSEVPLRRGAFGIPRHRNGRRITKVVARNDEPRPDCACDYKLTQPSFMLFTFLYSKRIQTTYI